LLQIFFTLGLTFMVFSSWMPGLRCAPASRHLYR
jgi:hypothetical protein